MSVRTFEELENDFKQLLRDAKDDEERIHQFLARYPALLPLWRPLQNVVFSKLALGNQYIVDFAFARENSLGLTWHLIEIEPPTYRLFNKSGDPSARFTHAQRQLLDWASWFEENRDYVAKHLPFGSRAREMRLSKPELILVMGRRSQIEDRNRSLLRSISEYPFRFMSFDRLTDELYSPAVEWGKPIKCCRYVSGRAEMIHSMRMNVSYTIS
jgi:hypothetical protein